MSKQIIKELDLSSQTAQELLIGLTQDIIALEDKVTELKDEIKDIFNTAKSEGLNPKSLKTAIKRYREYLKGSNDTENSLTESDLYLNVLTNQ